MDEETSAQVNLAVIEAGTNAIKHGNQGDPEKRAYFEFIILPDKFTIVIQDQGQGLTESKFRIRCIQKISSRVVAEGFF